MKVSREASFAMTCALSAVSRSARVASALSRRALTLSSPTNRVMPMTGPAAASAARPKSSGSPRRSAMVVASRVLSRGFSNPPPPHSPRAPLGLAQLDQPLAALPLVQLLLELQRLERPLVVDRSVLVGELRVRAIAGARGVVDGLVDVTARQRLEEVVRQLREVRP